MVVNCGGCNCASTVATAIAEVSEMQPLLSITTTLKLPELVTYMVLVVSPVDHKYEKPGVLERITESLKQTVVGERNEIVGVEGFGKIVTVACAESKQ